MCLVVTPCSLTIEQWFPIHAWIKHLSATLPTMVFCPDTYTSIEFTTFLCMKTLCNIESDNIWSTADAICTGNFMTTGTCDTLSFSAIKHHHVCICACTCFAITTMDQPLLRRICKSEIKFIFEKGRHMPLTVWWFVDSTSTYFFRYIHVFDEMKVHCNYNSKSYLH